MGGVGKPGNPHGLPEVREDAPPPPSQGVVVLKAILVALSNDERAELRRWFKLYCHPDGELHEPKERALPSHESNIAAGIRVLAPSERLYLKKWLVAWFTVEGYCREPPFLERKRLNGKPRRFHDPERDGPQAKKVT
jgi:hypothetical protein